MKPWYLILVFVLTSSAAEKTPWLKIECPTLANLNKVCFVDSVIGWVAGDSGTILKTTDGGQVWERQSSGMNNNILDFFILDRRFGWALALQFPEDTNWHGTILLRTTNGGSTWTRKNNPGEYYFGLTFLDSLNGFMGGVLGRIVKTTDGGSTWSSCLVDSSTYAGYPVLHFEFWDRNYGFAVGGRIDIAGVIWRTTNGGQRWTALCPDNAGEPIHDLHFIDSLNILAVGGDFDYGSNIVRSTDGGITWRYTFLNIWGEARAIGFRTPREGYVPLGFAATFMVTHDTGSTWRDFYTPESIAVYDVDFADSLHGYMVGDRGTVLKYDPPIVSVKGVAEGLPNLVMLEQNYPNPFNPTTEIGFRISDYGLVTLNVYDVLGRAVATLVHETKPPGSYAVQWNARGVASGVYFYRLTAPGFVTVKKLVVSK